MDTPDFRDILRRLIEAEGDLVVSYDECGPVWQLLISEARAALEAVPATPAPVPVAERLPGPEDCAPWPDDPLAIPWCWAARHVDRSWEWAQLSTLGTNADTLGRFVAGGGWTHWAPWWAFPIPAAQS